MDITKSRRSKRDDEEHHRKPGGKILRGCGRGGITRANPTLVSRLPASRIREAFLGSPALQQTNIVVSNLDSHVGDLDILQLFSRFGSLRFAKVQRNEAGKSLGKADVAFARRSDAIEAIKQCNGVAIDGRKMSIHFFSRRVKKPSSTAGKSNAESTGGQRRGRRKGYRRQKKALRHANEELCSQLEECMKNQLVISENDCDDVQSMS